MRVEHVRGNIIYLEDIHTGLLTAEVNYTSVLVKVGDRLRRSGATTSLQSMGFTAVLRERRKRWPNTKMEGDHATRRP